MHPCDDSFRHVWIKLITLWCYFLIPSWLPRGSCEVLLSLIRRFFGQFVGFVQILSWILSVQGGLNQTCRDEIFDIEIIQIPLADVERLRSNRFYGFWRFGFRDGVAVDWWLRQVSSAVVGFGRVFGLFAGFVQISSWILSVVGKLYQTCWDEQFDIEIIPILIADVERCRSNRFLCFFLPTGDPNKWRHLVFEKSCWLFISHIQYYLLY